MKFLPKILAYFFGSIIVLGSILFFFFPKFTSSIGFFIRANEANLTLKTTNVNGYQMNYYEGGNEASKDTLILLHGFADSKTGFLKMAKYLTTDYYVVIPDLLGHGENSKTDLVTYDTETQAKYFLALIDSMELKKFNLAGVSGGGLIVLEISRLAKNRTKSITLINTPYLTLDNTRYKKSFSFRIKDDQGLDSILSKVFFKTPNFSFPTKRYLIHEVDADLKFVNEHIIPKIKPENSVELEEKLGHYKNSVLVLHSTNDLLVPIENAELYCKIFPNSTYGTLKNTAQYPQYENPSGVAASISGQILKSQNIVK